MYKSITVHVKLIGDQNNQDADVEGDWSVDVSSDVPDAFLANVASFAFHNHVAIDDLEAFEISCSLDDDEIEQSDAAEAVNFEKSQFYGDVTSLTAVRDSYDVEMLSWC